MLTEYALTPHLFDDQYNADEPQWLERLRAFGQRLLPADSARVCNTVVSNLCDGSWYASAFKPLIQDLERRQDEDRSTRLPVLDLLKTLRPRLEGCLVKRPFSSDALPDDEEAWVGEAESSAARSGLAIHRLVGSHKLAPGSGRHGLGQTQDETFWNTVSTVQTIPASVDQQLLALRRMCSFYSFLAFASPQLSAQGSGKDLNFAIELARAASRRPRDFPPPQRIDFHAEGTTDGETQRAQQADAILRRVHAELGAAAAKVRVFLWRTVKERRLLVGHSDGSDGHPRLVWGVAMTHVARPDTDNPARDRHTFSVLDRRETSRLSSELVLLINKTGRFPNLEHHIARTADAVASCSIAPADAAFLASSLRRLPNDDVYNDPITLDLNGSIAVRARGDTGSPVTELVLTASSWTGQPLCVNSNRRYLARAMRLGFDRLHLFGPRAPVLCEDDRRKYVWALCCAQHNAQT